jgi:hypothetical protein
MGLYKVRGMFIEKENFNTIEGKSRLGSGQVIMVNHKKIKFLKLLQKIKKLRVQEKSKFLYKLNGSLIEIGLI